MRDLVLNIFSFPQLQEHLFIHYINVTHTSGHSTPVEKAQNMPIANQLNTVKTVSSHHFNRRPVHREKYQSNKPVYETIMALSRQNKEKTWRVVIKTVMPRVYKP